MTLLSDLVEFEKHEARRRRLLANPTPSQPLRLQAAKEPFMNKEDALERILIYHSTFVPSDVNPEMPHLMPLAERLARVELGMRETSHFKESLMIQALRSLKLDSQIPQPTLRP